MFSLKHTLSLACLLCTVACTASVKSFSTAQEAQESAAPKHIETIIMQSAKDAQIPGVTVAYIKHGKTQWVSVYGKANESSSVTDSTLFNVASLTKPVFSMVALQLVQSSNLSLDEPLSQYWIDPDVQDDERHNALSARLALSHQTGFTNWRGDKPLSFMFSPGERHEYSGEGFDYLRKAVEVKTEMTMPQLMADYITRPLSMTNTYFGWQPDLNDNIAARYDESAQEIQQKAFYKDTYSAACCTLTTINDYSKFVSWVAQGADLSESIKDELISSQAQHDNPVEHFGLGWRLISLPETTYLMHDGREPGVRAFTTVSPETGEGLLILTNSSNGELLYRPLIKATLTDQRDYLAQTDNDTWTYLTSVPQEVQPRMIQFIAQSPSFVSKALYAANEAVFSQAGTETSQQQLTQQKNQAEEYINEFVLGLANNTRDGVTFVTIIQSLSQSEDGTLLIKHDLNNTIEVDSWVDLLKQAAHTSNAK